MEETGALEKKTTDEWSTGSQWQTFHIMLYIKITTTTTPLILMHVNCIWCLFWIIHVCKVEGRGWQSG